MTPPMLKTPKSKIAANMGNIGHQMPLLSLLGVTVVSEELLSSVVSPLDAMVVELSVMPSGV